jgi:hypothetical protein
MCLHAHEPRLTHGRAFVSGYAVSEHGVSKRFARLCILCAGYGFRCMSLIRLPSHDWHSVELTLQDFLSWYKDMIAVSVITTVNAALCDYHVRHCDPSPQLTVVCNKVRCLQQQQQQQQQCSIVTACYLLL